jgi:hypothetical protein
MMNNMPLRLTILHFAQRLRMEGLTFIGSFSLLIVVQPKIELYLLYLHPSSFSSNLLGSWDSQDKRVTFSDSH